MSTMKFRQTVREWERLPVVIDMPTLCTILQCSDVTARKRIREGKFVAVKNGRDWLINRDSLRRFLEGGEPPPPEKDRQDYFEDGV